MNEKGIGKLGLGITAVVAIVVIALAVVWMTGGEQPFSLEGLPGGGETTISCGEIVPTYNFTATDEQGNQITDLNIHMYDLATGNSILAAPQSMASDRTVDVEGGHNYRVILTNDANTYYGVEKTLNFSDYLAESGKCKEDAYVSFTIKTTGSMALSAKNSESETTNSATAEQAISTTTVRPKLKFQGNTNNQSWNDGVHAWECVADFNGVELSALDVVPITAGLTATVTQDIPNGHKTTSLNQANKKAWLFEKPANSTSAENSFLSYDFAEWYLNITPSTTYDPVDSNILITCYDNYLFKDNKGNWDYEYRDPDDAGVVIGGPDAVLSFIYGNN